MARVIQRIELPWMSGYTTDSTTDGINVGGSEWESIKGGVSARGWVEFRGELGSAGVAVGIQTTNNRSVPGTPIRVCSFRIAMGDGDPDATLTSIDTGGFKYIRGLYLLRSVDGALAGGSFRGVVEILDT